MVYPVFAEPSLDPKDIIGRVEFKDVDIAEKMFAKGYVLVPTIELESDGRERLISLFFTQYPIPVPKKP